MMRAFISIVAGAAALAVAIGCGGASSSDGGSIAHTASAPTADHAVANLDARPNPQPTPDKHSVKAAKERKGGAAKGGIPLGVPLDARSPRVRKAIASLLHPVRARNGGESGSTRDRGTGVERGALGLLEKVLHSAEKSGDPASGGNRNPHGSRQGDPVHILEMLR
jgi:hypothetical protein